MALVQKIGQVSRIWPIEFERRHSREKRSARSLSVDNRL